jgi:indole-3-glycerol phosphate synthase
VTGVLDTIVAATRTSLTARMAAVPRAEMARRADSARRPGGDALRACLAAGGPSVIAECKRRSPSRGVLREVYDPVAIARGYAQAGAAAISVLTEPAFFDGALGHLQAVRAAVDVPLLRKDFTIDEYQIDEAVAAGADAVLLIVAALDDRTLFRLHASAHERALAVLVEVHGEGELDRALAAGASIVGVNNRNLRTLQVDIEASFRMVDRIPDGCVAVAESGLRTAEDVVALARAGYDAFLIGERFMADRDPGAALQSLLADVTRLAGEAAR